jgi:hypothetical protein
MGSQPFNKEHLIVIIDGDYQPELVSFDIENYRSADTMLADLYCCFNSAEFFHVAL